MPKSLHKVLYGFFDPKSQPKSLHIARKVSIISRVCFKWHSLLSSDEIKEVMEAAGRVKKEKEEIEEKLEKNLKKENKFRKESKVLI